MREAEIRDVSGITFTPHDLDTFQTEEDVLNAFREIFSRRLGIPIAGITISEVARTKLLAAWRASRHILQ